MYNTSLAGRAIFRMILTCSAAVLCAVTLCLAQSISYMDSAGTIHFVDSVGQIPPEYRDQVLPPTPTPTYSKRYHPTKVRTPKPTKTAKPTKTPKPTRTVKPTPVPKFVRRPGPYPTPTPAGM